VASRNDLEVLLAEHARRVDEELCVAADRVVRAGFDPPGNPPLHALVQLRIERAADELDTGDLPDLDAGDLDRRPRLQRADVVVVDVEVKARAQRVVAENEN